MLLNCLERQVFAKQRVSKQTLSSLAEMHSNLRSTVLSGSIHLTPWRSSVEVLDSLSRRSSPFAVGCMLGVILDVNVECLLRIDFLTLLKELNPSVML